MLCWSRARGRRTRLLPHNLTEGHFARAAQPRDVKEVNGWRAIYTSMDKVLRCRDNLLRPIPSPEALWSLPTLRHPAFGCGNSQRELAFACRRSVARAARRLVRCDRVLYLCATVVCYECVLQSCAAIMGYNCVLQPCVAIMCYDHVLRLCVAIVCCKRVFAHKRGGARPMVPMVPMVPGGRSTKRKCVPHPLGIIIDESISHHFCSIGHARESGNGGEGGDTNGARSRKCPPKQATPDRERVRMGYGEKSRRTNRRQTRVRARGHKSASYARPGDGHPSSAVNFPAIGRLLEPEGASGGMCSRFSERHGRLAGLRGTAST